MKHVPAGPPNQAIHHYHPLLALDEKLQTIHSKMERYGTKDGTGSQNDVGLDASLPSTVSSSTTSDFQMWLRKLKICTIEAPCEDGK
jgi:hypothetical protein